MLRQGRASGCRTPEVLDVAERSRCSIVLAQVRGDTLRLAQASRSAALLDRRPFDLHVGWSCGERLSATYSSARFLAAWSRPRSTLLEFKVHRPATRDAPRSRRPVASPQRAHAWDSPSWADGPVIGSSNGGCDTRSGHVGFPLPMCSQGPECSGRATVLEPPVDREPASADRHRPLLGPARPQAPTASILCTLWAMRDRMLTKGGAPLSAFIQVRILADGASGDHWRRPASTRRAPP